jgi:hypothetical protein
MLQQMNMTAAGDEGRGNPNERDQKKNLINEEKKKKPPREKVTEGGLGGGHRS